MLEDENDKALAEQARLTAFKEENELLVKHLNEAQAGLKLEKEIYEEKCL